MSSDDTKEDSTLTHRVEDSVEPDSRLLNPADFKHAVLVSYARALSLRLTPRKIILLPGYRLAAAAKFLLTRAAFNEYVEPVIADMQEEYIQDVAAGRKWHARWIAVRGWLLVIPGWLYAFVAGKLAGLLRRGQ